MLDKKGFGIKQLKTSLPGREVEGMDWRRERGRMEGGRRAEGIGMGGNVTKVWGSTN